MTTDEKMAQHVGRLRVAPESRCRGKKVRGYACEFDRVQGAGRRRIEKCELQSANCKLGEGPPSPLTPLPRGERGSGRRDAYPTKGERGDSAPSPWPSPKGRRERKRSGTKFGGASAKLIKPHELSAEGRCGGKDWRAGSCGEVERGGPRKKGTRR